MTDKQLTELIISEIRENRREINEVRESLTNLKIKMAPVLVAISILLSIGLNKWLST